MSAVLSILPKAEPRPTWTARPSKKQLAKAPPSMRAPLKEALSRGDVLRQIAAKGLVPVVVVRPSLWTVLALVQVLSFGALVRVVAMSLGLGANVRVFASSRVVDDLAPASWFYRAAVGLLYAGSGRWPLIVRVERAVRS